MKIDWTDWSEGYMHIYQCLALDLIANKIKLDECNGNIFYVDDLSDICFGMNEEIIFKLNV